MSRRVSFSCFRTPWGNKEGSLASIRRLGARPSSSPYYLFPMSGLGPRLFHMSRKRNLVVLLLACVWASLLVVPQAQADVTFTVTSTADTDDGTCNSSCTLREAINAIRDVEGTDEIDFALPGHRPTLHHAGGAPTTCGSRGRSTA